MKTFYFLAFCFWIQLTSEAQFQTYQLDELEQRFTKKENSLDGSKPVYYNFSRRKLYNNDKMVLNPKSFLEMCRGINDLNIQHQIRKYDELTRNKKKLLGAMIVCGVGGYVGLMSSMIMTSSSGGYNNDGYTVMGISAFALFIVTPALAISTTVPHQRRKEILFRDLPEAYNFHVTSLNNQ